MLQANLAESGFPNPVDATILWNNDNQYPLDLGRISLSSLGRDGIVPESVLLAEIQQRNCLNAASLEALLQDKHNLPVEWRLKVLGQAPCIFAFGTIYSRNYHGKKFVRYITANKAVWVQGEHYLEDFWFPFCLSAEWN